MYSARSDPCLIDSPSSKHFACYQAGLLKGLLCSLRSHESLSPYTFAQEGFCAHFVRTKALHRTLLHRKAFVLTSFARKPFTVHFCTGRLLCSLRSHESPSPYTFAQEGFCAHFVRTKADQARVGFPHSDICGSKLVCQLPAAFRRLQRLSSPVIAKASTTCTYSLDPITLSPLARYATSFFRLAFVTSSIRLEWIRFDTIKTHVFHAFALTGFPVFTFA